LQSTSQDFLSEIQFLLMRGSTFKTKSMMMT
jgi:hypothetical protein